ncbi:hypothetical protein BDZ89DRAFT_1164064 [Hymenopellis radicata]|nr:hypothetical protein BDZ89DRAFT_1164064 [Hymenopellis radicata]
MDVEMEDDLLPSDNDLDDISPAYGPLVWLPLPSHPSSLPATPLYEDYGMLSPLCSVMGTESEEGQDDWRSSSPDSSEPPDIHSTIAYDADAATKPAKPLNMSWYETDTDPNTDLGEEPTLYFAPLGASRDKTTGVDQSFVYTPPRVDKRYGTMPITGADPVEPLHPHTAGIELHWRAELLRHGVLDTSMLPHILKPDVPPHPPSRPDLVRPTASTFELHVGDPRYLGGVVYISKYNPANKVADTDRQKHMEMPVNEGYRVEGGQLVRNPLRGCIEATPGVVYAVEVDTNEYRGFPISIVCYQTLDSLKRLMPENDYKQLLTNVGRFLELVWGTSTFTGLTDTPLKPNDRSNQSARKAQRNAATEPRFGDGQGTADVEESEEEELGYLPEEEHDKADGSGLFTGNISSSIGSTVLKGEGQGWYHPTKNNATPEAKALLWEFHRHIRWFFRKIFPYCVNRLEYECQSFKYLDSNAISLGGYGPSPLSVQHNRSDSVDKWSSIDDLVDAIIAALKALGLQGRIHNDGNDAVDVQTECTFTFRLNKAIRDACYAGGFLYARSGIYVGSLDLVISWAHFSGHDLHSGEKPGIIQNIKQAFKQNANLKDIRGVWKTAGPANRNVFVGYTTSKGFHRQVPLRLTPDVGFGTHGLTTARMQYIQSFVPDGEHLMGTRVHRLKRLIVESVYRETNAALVTGLPAPSLKEAVDAVDMKYLARLSGELTLADMSWEEMTIRRAVGEWHKRLCETYTLFLYTHQLLVYMPPKVIPAPKRSLSPPPAAGPSKRQRIVGHVITGDTYSLQVDNENGQERVAIYNLRGRLRKEAEIYVEENNLPLPGSMQMPVEINHDELQLMLEETVIRNAIANLERTITASKAHRGQTNLSKHVQRVQAENARLISFSENMQGEACQAGAYGDLIKLITALAKDVSLVDKYELLMHNMHAQRASMYELVKDWIVGYGYTVFQAVINETHFHDGGVPTSQATSMRKLVWHVKHYCLYTAESDDTQAAVLKLHIQSTFVGADIASVPTDLYGVVTTSASGSLKLPPSPESPAAVLADLFERAFIIPQMAHFSPPHSATELKRLRNETLWRGELVTQLKMATGSEAIVYLLHIRTALDTAPSLLDRPSRIDRLGSKIIKGDMPKLFASVSDDIKEALTSLSDSLDTAFQTVKPPKARKIVVHAESDNENDEREPPSLETRKAAMRLLNLLVEDTYRWQKKDVNLPCLVTANEKFLNGYKPTNDLTASIRMPGLAKAEFNNDWIQPFRYSMNSQIDKFRGVVITRPTGLSQLLTFHGMGMGYATRQAFTHMKPPFLSEADAVEKFNAAIAENLVVSNTRCWGQAPNEHLAHEHKEVTPKEKPVRTRRRKAESVESDAEMETRGATSRARKGRTTSKRKTSQKSVAADKPATERRMQPWTLESKLAIYFSSTLQALWTEFLNDYDLADIDPSTTNRRKPTAVEFDESKIGKHLKKAVAPFKSLGLTRLQLVASLVQLGVLAPYSDATMAGMISTLKKGAVAGLTHLGFDTSSPAAIKTSFQKFHRYMVAVVPEQKKKFFGYTTSSSEHLLCKVGRWKEYGGDVLWTEEWRNKADDGDWVWREYDATDDV